MFQKNIDKLFNYIPNVFSIPDNIGIAGYDAYSNNHDTRLGQIFLKIQTG